VNSSKLEDIDLNEDDFPEMDLALGNKDACILEVGFRQNFRIK